MLTSPTEHFNFPLKSNMMMRYFAKEELRD